MTFDFGLQDDNEAEPTQSTEFNLQEYQMEALNTLQQPKWLIRDLLFERQIAVAYAPPGSFKSFVALDLASRLTHGMEWNGCTLRGGRVVYVAGEGFPMFKARRLAWFKKNNLKPVNDGLSVVNGAVNLRKTEMVTGFLKLVRQNPIDISLIIFDTLSTMIAGEAENDSAVMSDVIANAKFIGKELNCAILFIHHPGKDVSRGSRGHSSLLGNIDAEWCIEREEGAMGCSLTVTKQKDSEDRRQFHYEAQRISLGLIDNDGVEMASLALSPCGVPTETDHALSDRLTIAAMIPVDTSMPIAHLITPLMFKFGKGNRVTRYRIKAAIPTTWTRIRSGEDVVEIRYCDNGERKASHIEVRSVRKTVEA